jgi:ferric-dicitrate binding protein FerR (iron transport regulator)
MNKIFDPKKHAYMVYFDPDEFIELLVKYHDGEASKQETRYVEQQLKENEQARNLWQDVLITFATEDAKNGHTEIKRHKRPLPHWLAAAAILLLLVLGDGVYHSLHKQQPTFPKAHYEKAIILRLADGHIIQLGNKPSDSFPHLAKMPASPMDGKYARLSNTLAVPYGFTYAFKLPDSTTVYINSDTELEFPFVFNSSRREVHVEGEAYFDVAQDPGRPFVVHTKHADVIALGTSFNVSTYDNEFRTSLLTGAVVVMEKNKMIQLSPGQLATKDPRSGDLVVDTFIKDSLPGWVNGRYVFSKKPLEEVCGTIERLYDVEIIFDRREIARQRYNGAVNRKERVEVFLDNVAKTLRIRWYWDEEKRVHLK